MGLGLCVSGWVGGGVGWGSLGVQVVMWLDSRAPLVEAAPNPCACVLRRPWYPTQRNLGDCNFKMELLRGNLGLRKQHQKCVRRRAELVGTGRRGAGLCALHVPVAVHLVSRTAGRC